MRIQNIFKYRFKEFFALLLTTTAYKVSGVIRIWSYSGPYFAAFGLYKERYSVSLFIQSECGIMRARITPNADTFHAVRCFQITLGYLQERNFSYFSPTNFENTFLWHFRVLGVLLGLNRFPTGFRYWRRNYGTLIFTLVEFIWSLKNRVVETGPVWLVIPGLICYSCYTLFSYFRSDLRGQNENKELLPVLGYPSQCWCYSYLSAVIFQPQLLYFKF